ncbi:hypothetical protein BGC07_11500 [Piscirickettsia litoralis]|uniref:Uncharacterized protein n=1 Tax=Piscirickettsia litoralis TaxID=1891921 RepID=A0ABX3A7C2_9GAMM|nr:hypothetical protein BGC07_11500 [Piscirickettsia litoralis]
MPKAKPPPMEVDFYTWPKVVRFFKSSAKFTAIPALMWLYLGRQLVVQKISVSRKRVGYLVKQHQLFCKLEHRFKIAMDPKYQFAFR